MGISTTEEGVEFVGVRPDTCSMSSVELVGALSLRQSTLVDFGIRKGWQWTFSDWRRTDSVYTGEDYWVRTCMCIRLKVDTYAFH